MAWQCVASPSLQLNAPLWGPTKHIISASKHLTAEHCKTLKPPNILNHAASVVSSLKLYVDIVQLLSITAASRGEEN